MSESLRTADCITPGVRLFDMDAQTWRTVRHVLPDGLGHLRFVCADLTPAGEPVEIRTHHRDQWVVDTNTNAAPRILADSGSLRCDGCRRPLTVLPGDLLATPLVCALCSH